MGISQPWQYEEPNPVLTKAVPTATVIEGGDLIGQDSNGMPYPASDQTWNTDLATTQTAFVVVFLGCTPEYSRNGDVEPINVNTNGVHVFDCAAATFKVGDLVGPAKQSGNLLERRKVVSVATEALAIGRVSKDYPSNTTSVFVRIFSSKTKGRTA